MKLVISKMLMLTILSSLLISCKKDNLSKLSDSFHLKSNGADMPVHVFGNASDQTFIILLHGGPGDNGLAYRAGMYAEKLEEKYAMVYWDQRGQGMSQGNFVTDKLTVDEMAKDLYNLILCLKVKYGQDISIFLMGHSWGGTLGTYYMVKDNYQDLVNGWIEVDGAHDIPLLNKVVVEMFDTIGTAQIALGNSKSEWRRIVKWAKKIDTSNIDLNVGSEINSNAFYAEDLLWEDGIVKDESE
ncbi:MAG TPA: alpha/beta hydrolase, partial [Bacteroidetes bacterium]|nr:alpha/beta hydrolase [Bacteroidota bacterium]